MSIGVRYSPKLHEHLEKYEVDGATVASALFEGGRLSYPGRKEIEFELGDVEPYTLWHEARVIEGLPQPVQAAVRVLGKTMRRWLQLAGDLDPTLELLWTSHEAYIAGPDRGGGEISLDRLIAALTMVQALSEVRMGERDSFVLALEDAAATLIGGLEAAGFFPSSESLEELFDGAAPACVGLGLVDIDWKVD